MKKLGYIAFSLLLILGVNSCSDDFIDVDNKEILTEASFWQTENDALQALTATYAALQGHSGSKWNFFEEIYTSSTYRGDDILNNSGEPYGRAVATFTNTTEQSGPFNLWRGAYAGIGRANQVIDKVGAMENIDADFKKVVIAEAKFLRALYNFWLVTSFENGPLVLSFETNPNDLTNGNATPTQFWEQIEADLRDAKNDMLDSHEDAWAGRATKGAATAMLGKVYLFQEKWGEAEDEFRTVVESNQYDLLPNFADNFNGNGENGAESIFEIQFSANLANDNDERQVLDFEVVPYELGGWELFYPSMWLVDEMKTDLADDGSISERVYESIFFDDPNSQMADIGSGSLVSYSAVAANLNHPVYFKKYSKNTDDEGYYSGTNISIIRYADVLLMYAEALNENDKATEAIAEINKVRVRGGAAELDNSMSKEQLRTQIRHHERPVELSMEFGIRWYDLYRWQKGSTATESIKATLESHAKPFAENYQDKHIVFPIPLQELDVNPNLQQTDGW